MAEEGRDQPERRLAMAQAQAIRRAREAARRAAASVVRAQLGPLPPPAPELGLPADAIVALPVERPVTLYRLVWNDPPSTEDVRSNLLKGKRPFPREWAIIHAGMSMYDAPELALRRARRSPKLVAAVELVPDHGFYVARTFESEGHFTVWVIRMTYWGVSGILSMRRSIRGKPRTCVEFLRPRSRLSKEGAMTYQVIDEYGNVLGRYDSREEAERELAEYLEDHPEQGDDLALAAIDDAGKTVEVRPAAGIHVQ
jgi:hypothetical protein